MNEVTWKLTDTGLDSWSGGRGGNHRTARAIAWLLGIWQRPMGCPFRDNCSKPMKLPKHTPWKWSRHTQPGSS